jgi:hypothetical protein
MTFSKTLILATAALVLIAGSAFAAGHCVRNPDVGGAEMIKEKNII